jgi:hypothetical protein
MSGCGRAWNGEHVVDGASLRCGEKLYWKLNALKPQERTLEVNLCPQCKEKEQ